MSNNLWSLLKSSAKRLTPECPSWSGFSVDEGLAVGGFGVAKITPFSSGLFEFEGNLPVVLIPVFWDGSRFPRFDSDLIDLFAFRPSNPREWWLFRNDADMLGTTNGLYLGEPLIVHTDPVSWIRSKGKGVFVLDWKRAAPRLRCVENIVVSTDDISFAQTVRTRLGQVSDIPKIYLYQNIAEAA